MNVLSELGAKKSDDALIFDAKRAVNEMRYDDAVLILTQELSAGGQTKAEAREVLASAYAGKCGLNFLNYTNSLSTATSGSAFVLMSSPFIGVSVAPNFCLTALQTLDLIGTNAQRTQDQNAFAAVLGMVLLGSATRQYTDSTPATGDGAQDALNISCTLTDAQVDNVVLGYAYMSQNYSSVSGQIGSTSSTTISDSINICNSVAGSSCSNTDPTAITPLVRDTMRDLMNTADYGVGTADGSSTILIPAACP